MSDLHNKTPNTEKALRHKAEALVTELEQNKNDNTRGLKELPVTEIEQMVHELRVHQIQLEMQNEQLRTAQTEIDISRSRYFELYDMSPVGYCTSNEAGIIEEVNLTLANLLGLPRSKLLMKPLSSLIYRDDQDNYYLKTKLMKVNGQPFSCELRMLTSDRELLWVHLASSSRKKADGTVEFHIGVSDITEQRMLQQQQRIAAIAFESLYGMFITDAQGLILQVNRAFISMTGYSDEEIVGQTRDILNSGRHPTSFFIEMRKNLKQQGKWSGEIWDRRKNGEVYPIWMTITTVKNNEEDVSHCVYTLRDITEKKVAEEQISNLAFYDPLTKLPNRRLMLDRLKHALSSRARHKRLGAVMMIDLDNFKTLNDSLGHDVGDKLLVSVASRLESCMREGDTVSRIGGDEFVVIIEVLDETILVHRQAEAVALFFAAGWKQRSTEHDRIPLFLQCRYNPIQ